MERWLAQCWEELLGTHPVGITDDFFALGGDSLLAVTLVVAIERAHGVKLPLSAVLEAPTIDRLALVIARGTPAAWSPLIAIRREGTGTPLVCIHGLYGNVLCFRDLASRLARPCHGLQAQALDPDATPLTTVEAIAATYVAALRTQQAHGPYFLAGYSFGGMVAFEMAHQLRTAGAQVGALILIDTTAPGVHRAAPPFYTTAYVRWPSAQRYFALDRVVTDGRTGDRPGRWSLRGLSDDSLLRFVHVERAATAATRAYRPRSYAGHALLVRAAHHHGHLAYEPAEGWGRLVAKLEIVDLPGDHVTILSPPWVDMLARTVDGYVDAAVRTAPP
jgi:thioesterase domain-containing protein/acyl carrier protein